MNNGMIWAIIILVAWGLSLWAFYGIGWNYGEAAGIRWCTEQTYGKR